MSDTQGIDAQGRPEDEIGELSWLVDALAQEIRRVDGNHSLGAGALAEHIIAWLAEMRGAKR